MMPEITKTNRRQRDGFKAFADQFRTFGDKHYVCLECYLADETIKTWLARLREEGIAARKVGDAIYVRHDQADDAFNILNP